MSWVLYVTRELDDMGGAIFDRCGENNFVLANKNVTRRGYTSPFFIENPNGHTY